MRTLVLALLVTVAGCGGSQPPGSTGGYDQFGCKIGCDRCPMQTLCIGVPYVPACLVQCTITADCDPGLRCALVESEIAPAVCVSAGSLSRCDPPATCALTNHCRDASTQLKPLPAAFGVCGLEVIHCDMGCDTATGSCK